MAKQMHKRKKKRFDWIRRQKKKAMIIIMGLLMVSFLLTGFIADAFLRKNPNDEVIGRTKFRQITRGDLSSANADMDIIRQLRLPRQQGQMLQMITRGGKDPQLTLAMLIAEAEGNGIKVNDAEVDNFLEYAGLEGASFNKFADRLLAERSITRKHIRSAVTQWLKAYKSFVDASVITPPSKTQVLHAFADVAEKIDLKVAIIPCEKYIKQLNDPTDKQIDEMFEKYRKLPPGNISEDSPFGFGYIQPERINVNYMLVNIAPLERAIKPAESDVMDYWLAHKKEFVKKVPVPEPQTKPTSNPATEPAAKPVKTTDEQMDFYEASVEISKKLSLVAVRVKLDNIVRKIKQMAQSAPQLGDAEGQNVYKYIENHLVSPAGETMEKNLGIVSFNAVPLAEVIETLSRRAELKAICYPWGRLGGATLDENMKITLPSSGRTLGEALSAVDEIIREQIPDWPEIKWITFEPVNGVIFPIAGKTFPSTMPAFISVNSGTDISKFAPLISSTTGISDAANLSIEDIFKNARDPIKPDITFIKYAFGKRDTSDSEQGSVPILAVGADCPELNVDGEDVEGVLLWAITERIEPHVPEEMDSEIRKQVVDDWKIEKSFDQANELAKEIKDASDLDFQIKQKKLRNFTTGLFARKQLLLYYNAIIPVAIPELKLSGQAVETFREKAFSLCPAKYTVDSIAKSNEVLAIPLPSQQFVAVIQRIGYEPPRKENYNLPAGSDGTLTATFRAEEVGVASLSMVHQLPYLPQKDMPKPKAIFNIDVQVRPGFYPERFVFKQEDTGRRVMITKGGEIVLVFNVSQRQRLTAKIDGDAIKQEGSDYIPGKNSIINLEMASQQNNFIMKWFSQDDIIARTGFLPGPGDE